MKMIQSRSKKFISMMAALFVVLFGIIATGCGGGGGGDSYTPPATTIEAPDAPTALSAIPTPDTTLSATLNWTAPTTGGEVAFYDIYRSETAGTAYPENLRYSIPVTDVNKTDYEFIDNVGLVGRQDYFWVVAARNAGGEAPSNEATTTVRGPASGGGDTSYGNNFAGGLIFADGIGLTGEPITGAWTLDTLGDVTTTTALRPTAEQLPNLDVFPYWDDTTKYMDTDYYQQQTVSTWQGQWEVGVGPQEVNASWGDNLVSQPSLTTNSVVRIETVLTKDITGSPMKTYNMVHLNYPVSGINEIWGTDGTTYDNNTSFVFDSKATISIQQVDGDNIIATVEEDTPLWQCDGPGCFGAEVTVSGKMTYGYVWRIREDNILNDASQQGTWRITFKLDPTGNTTIGTLASENGSNIVKVSDYEIYIDINIGQAQ